MVYLWIEPELIARVCTQQAPVRSRVGIMAVAANVGEPDLCQSCGEDLDDHTLLFIELAEICLQPLPP